MKIPLYKPEVTAADVAAVLAVLRSGWISYRGPAVGRFEKAFAAAVGAKYAVAVSSGTAALHCALVAAGVRPGDKVIVPGLTYVATSNAVLHAGAEPVFADVGAESWTISATSARIVGPCVKAIIPVHLYGFPPAVDLQGWGSHARVDDAAEALGGDVYHCEAAWSFFANKSLTCGEGGMVTTSSEAVANAAYALSHQGQQADAVDYDCTPGGYNYRMTAMQAALGWSQLRRLRSTVVRKRVIARWYREGLAGLPVRLQADHPQHAWWLVSARVQDRDGLRKHLAARGIETRPVFPAMGDTPVAHRIAAEGLSLPSWPGLSRAQVAAVCAAVKEFYR